MYSSTHYLGGSVMIKSISKKEEMKQIVLEQLAYFFLNEVENITDLHLCNVSEDILLWQIEYEKKIKLYFYTDRNYKLLFNEQVFTYASPFSKGCGLAKTINTKTEKEETNVIDLNLRKIVEVPTEEMDCLETYNIRNGNMAMYGNNGHWGSYFYNEEENAFLEDIPFIWDALEFSKDGNNVVVGLRNYQSILNPDLENKWKPDKVEMKIKMMEALKEYAYDTTLYRQFLSYVYKNKLSSMEIYPTENVERSLTPQMEECFIREFHDLYGYASETPILNTCTNRTPNIVDTGSLDEYTRVRGRVLK